MNRTSRRSARRLPKVDLPAPRNPVGGREMRVEQRSRLAEPVKGQPTQQLDNPSQFHRLVRFGPEQSGKRQVERVADPAQQFDREIALSAFELREVALRQAGV